MGSDAAEGCALPSLRLPALLLQALSGRAVDVRPLDAAHPAAALRRPVLAPGTLLLPAPEPSFAPGQQRQLQRAAVAHAAAHLRYSQAGRSSRSLKPLALAVLSAIEDARVERLLARDFPGVRRWFDAFLPGDAQPRGLDLGSLLARLDRVLADPARNDDNHWVDNARRQLLAVPDLHDAQAFHRIGLVLANELGQMRVPFDPALPPAGPAYRDDHSFLWDHGQAAQADALPSAQDAPAHGKPGHRVQEDATPAEPAVRHVAYGEWHERLGLWREGWCTVHERPSALPAQAPVAVAPRARASHLRERWRTQHRQLEGDAIDLGAAVAARVDRARGLPWDPRLFARTTYTTPRTSVLLLLDLSQSASDPWAGGLDSVLAVQQQAALALARDLQDCGARIAVHGFASNTRAEVGYWRAVDFCHGLDAARIAAVRDLQARHSTRLGAALRHAQALLGEEPAERRALVLLSDGAPSDVDVHEAGHLVHDARRAVQQLRAGGLRAGCIAFDTGARTTVQAIFGPAACCMAVEAAGLARRLAAWCRGTLIA